MNIARLFFSQVEYRDNLVFDRRAALDALGERLFDANRTIGQPSKLAAIYGRKVTKRYRGKLETLIEDLDLPKSRHPQLLSGRLDQTVRARPPHAAHRSHVQ